MNKGQQNNKNKNMSNKESKKTSAKSSSKPPKKPSKPRKQSRAEDDIFTVEYIVAERLVYIVAERPSAKKARKNGKSGGGPPMRQFYIKWHGYSDVHNTWEPEQNLLDPTILAEWRELHPLSSTSTSSEADKSKGLKRKSPASSEEEEEVVKVKDEDEEEEGGEAKKKKKIKKPKTSLRKAPGTPQQPKQQKKKKQWLPKKAKSSSKKKGSAKSSATTAVRKSISEQAIATIDVPVSIPGAAAASQPAIIFTELLMTEPVWHHIHADQARIDHVLDTSGVSSPESADELMV